MYRVKKKKKKDRKTHLNGVSGRKSKIILTVSGNNNIFNSRCISFNISNEFPKFTGHGYANGVRYVECSSPCLNNFSKNLIKKFPIRPGIISYHRRM